MGQIAELFVKVGADISELTKRMDKAHDAVDSAFKPWLGGSQAVATAVGIAGAAIGAMAAKTVADLANVETINAQTAAAIKSTGGAAGIAAGHVSDLAGAIENATGIEAESVQQGENLLLTFTNIKNGVGKGNDVFDQATHIMADMATAMGTDVKGGAIQLGKALNDPIAGVSALSRVGVTFDDQQKATIETLVKSGKTMDAQKIILNELNKEFGGSAMAAGETFAGSLKKLDNQFGNVNEAIMGGFMPVLKTMADTGAKFFGDLANAITDQGLVGGLAAVTSPEIKAAFVGIAVGITGAMVPALASAATAAWAAITPFTPFIAAAGLVAVAAYAIFKNWQPISEFFQMIWQGVTDGITTLYGNFKSVFGGIGGVVQAVVNFIRDKFGWVFNLLPDNIKTALANGATALQGLPGIVVDKIKGVSGAVSAPLSSLKGIMGGHVQAGVDAAGAAAANLPKAVAGPASEAAKKLAETWADVPKQMAVIEAQGKAFGSTFDVAGAKASALESAIKSLIEQGVKPTDGHLQKLIGSWRQYTAQADAAKISTYDVGKVATKAADEVAGVAERAKIFGDTSRVSADQTSILERAITDMLDHGIRPGNADLDGLISKWKQLGGATPKASNAVADFGKSVQGAAGEVSNFAGNLNSTIRLVSKDFNDPFVNFLTTGAQFATGVAQMGIQLVAFIPQAIAGATAAWGFTAALLANPITWVVLGVAALIAALAGLVVYWDPISKWLMDSFGKVGEFFQNVFGGLGGFLHSVFDGLIGILKAPFNLMIAGANAIIHGLNSISFKIPDWVPGIGGQNFGVSIPEIPYLAKGGVATGPTLAMIGEGTSNEAVLPLNRGVFASLADGIANAAPRGGLATAGGPAEITLNFYGINDVNEIADQLVRVLNRKGIGK